MPPSIGDVESPLLQFCAKVEVEAFTMTARPPAWDLVNGAMLTPALLIHPPRPQALHKPLPATRASPVRLRSPESPVLQFCEKLEVKAFMMTDP